METDKGFSEFWKVYPRKVAKEAARRMYCRALKIVDPETILRGATRYADERSREDPKFTKHPATWLNAGCWDDETTPQGVYRNGNSVLGAFDRLEQALASADDHEAGSHDLLGVPQGRLCGPR